MKSIIRVFFLLITVSISAQQSATDSQVVKNLFKKSKLLKTHRLLKTFLLVISGQQL